MSLRTAPSRRRSLALLALLSLGALQLQAVLASAAVAQNNACQGAFQGNPSGSLAMTANKPNGATIAGGETLTFTITWNTNDWTSLDQFQNCFEINGSLDASLTYAEFPPANDGSIVHSITVPNNLQSGDELCARARLSGQPTGGNSTQKSNTLCFTVGTVPQGNPDVTIGKSSSATNVTPGDEFTYTLTAQNVGNADASNVQIHDTIPSGLTIVSVPNGCSTSGQTVTCNLGTLAQGASQSVTFTVRATDAACPKVDNFGTVSASNEPGSNTGNNTSNTVTVNVTCTEPGISVRIVKTNDANGDGIYSDSEEAKKDDLDVPFTLVITNTGSEPVVITDLTDSFEQTTLDLLVAKCASLDGVTLAPGESVTCTFTLNNYSPPQGETLVDTAEVCVHMEGDTSRTDCDDDDSRVRSAVVLGRTVTPTPTPPPTRTPPGGIAFTGPGDGTIGFGLLAIALLLVGTGAMYAGYRKRARDGR